MTDQSNYLKAAYFTLGCKLNFAETSTIGKILSGKGIIRAAKGEIPDICVVNTCSVTEMADKKGRRLIRSLASRYPDATIVVTGCYAQLKPEAVAALPGVDIVLGSNEKLKIAEYIESWLSDRRKRTEVTPVFSIKEFHPSCERGDRTRFFLKVQDGCNYFCTYCTIPYARGRSRSGVTEDLVSMAREAVAAGGKEIVITGVNIGEYGKDNGQDLFSLLRRLDEVEGIERYRISSIEPNLLTEEIIRWIAEESRAFMPHFHIPLQSGSDAVLKLMNRRYDTSLFSQKIKTVREMIPDAFIGVDIIAGARGETPEQWERSLSFAESLDVTRYHVFPYSERPGTKALLLGDAVSQEEKHRRVSMLTKISDLKMESFMRKNLGTVRPVLWEHPSGEGMMHGLTDNYLRVQAPLDMAMINTVVPTLLESIHEEEHDLIEGRPAENMI